MFVSGMYMVGQKMGADLVFLKLCETKTEADQWAELYCDKIETDVRFVQVEISEPWEHADA